MMHKLLSEILPNPLVFEAMLELGKTIIYDSLRECVYAHRFIEQILIKLC